MHTRTEWERQQKLEKPDLKRALLKGNVRGFVITAILYAVSQVCVWDGGELYAHCANHWPWRAVVLSQTRGGKQANVVS
jgi:hypothetical protein